MDPWEDRLLRFAQLKRADRDRFFEALAHEKQSGLPLLALCQEAADERFRLARLHLREASLHLAGLCLRSAISRAYYAFYHAMRSVSFVAYGGDDFQEHKDLPSHVPADFPDREKWESELRNARALRNQADYDPYPTDPRFWESEAKRIVAVVADFLPEAANYLKARGGSP